MSDGFTELKKEKKRDAILKQRKGLRQELLLQNINKLSVNKAISTMDLYHECFNNGYSYSFGTLKDDLRELEESNKIVKTVKYQGKGTGTKGFWGKRK